jgi:diguanylate cyclase (GGDEF)-like protein
MRLELTFLRSRIGRRAFWFFTLLLVIPVAITVALAVDHVVRRLTEQALEQLHQDAKGYGMSVMERLLILQNRLLDAGGEIARGEGFERIDKRQSEYFNALAVVQESGEIRPVFGDPDRVSILIDDIAGGITPHEKRLYSVSSSNQTSRVFMLNPVGQKKFPVLIAELKARYLWGPDDSMPGETDICALNDRHEILFCSGDSHSSALEQISGKHGDTVSGPLNWDQGDQPYVGHYWTLFSSPAFGTNWAFLATKSRNDVLRPISAFKTFFVPLILFVLVVVLLLIVVQIRKQLGPLDKLMEGTRRIAARHFDEPVELTSNDEFGDLADSFNSMASRLGKQFKALETLAEVDQLILSALDLESVVSLMLRRTCEIAACDAASITLVDRDAPRRARIGIQDGDDGAEPEFQRITLDREDVRYLLERRSGFGLNAEATDKPFLAPLRGRGVKSHFILPILLEDRLCGIIGLGYRCERGPNEDELSSMRDFAHRVAVAISAAEREEQLYQQAHYDSLTGLPNRHLFNDRLAQALVQARRDDSLVGLLFIDLDRFKYVNDSAGHPAGDVLLKRAAERLNECVRETDTVARLGGDEFTIILPAIDRSQDSARVAKTIINRFAESFAITGREYYITASIGITLYPFDGQSSEDLLKNADTAMYVAKDQGRNRFSFYEPHMNAESTKRIVLEAELRQAVDREEFTLNYQPQINIDTGRVTGAEALLRWQHPEKGVVDPNEFITVAEDSGLIERIGPIVLRKACEQCKAWRDAGLDLDYLGINVSAREFRQGDFVDNVLKALEEWDTLPGRFGLEITERLLMDETDDVLEKLNCLKRAGVKLAIDDFGTGYSSLGYLRKFPVDTLKIDKLFIDGISAEDGGGDVVRAMLAMARALRLEVIAEGVESEVQLAFLRAEQCHQVQGYYYSRPLSAAAFVEYVHHCNGTAPSNRQAS